MSNPENLFLFASIVLCALSSVLHIYGLIFGKERLSRWGRVSVWLFLASVSVTIGVRWNSQGHGPYITLYEVLLSNVWIATILFLLVGRVWKEVKMLGAFFLPGIFLTIGAVVMSPSQASQLTPSYRSIWLILHVLFAKLTYGSILIATALSVSVILKEYLDPGKHGFLNRLPEPGFSDRLSYKLIASSLFFATIMIVSGSIWANQLWGKYWGWDPVEVWSLATWIIYGLYLHLRITFKFSGISASFYIVVAFLLSVFSFFIMPYVIPTVHNSFMFRG